MMRTAELIRRMRGDGGFTLVELMIAAVVASIIVVGMVGLMASIFNVFKETSDLQALNDSSRRALAGSLRVLRTSLHFDNNSNLTNASKVAFWADIDNDQVPNTTTPATWLDIDRYTLAEKVQLYRDADSRLMMWVKGGTESTTRLGSYVSEVKFFYFPVGTMPGGTDPYNPTGGLPDQSDINAQVSMIRVVLKLSKGNIHRSYYQDVFLRIIERRPD
jgi:prepilin-type N-terminal cleavage/methylation domain-containing protein